jgi:RHS repeat-associated protein
MLVDTSGGLSHVVAETDSTGALSAVYVRRGDELLSVMRPAAAGTWTTRYVHHDALGSVRALTDETGTTVDSRGYEAFGTMNVEAGNDPLPYRFAGEAFESTSKLAYHRARWMDSRVGRFQGMDPWEGNPGNPTTLHRFLYGGGNPVSWVDPSGWDFDSVSISVMNVCMNVMSSMAVATPRLFLVTVTGMRAVAQVAQMFNDEFSTGGAVTLNPTSMLTREGVEVAKTVAEVKPLCASGGCVNGVDILRARLLELFSSLTTKTVMMRTSSGRGTFEVTEQVRRAVPGTVRWDMHVAAEIEGGQIIDPTIGRVFRNEMSGGSMSSGLRRSRTSSFGRLAISRMECW